MQRSYATKKNLEDQRAQFQFQCMDAKIIEDFSFFVETVICIHILYVPDEAQASLLPHDRTVVVEFADQHGVT